MNTITKTIEFVRRSAIPRLYEHMNIHCQGKKGDAVYAVSAISASQSHSIDECISENELALLDELVTDKERNWALIRNAQEAKIWEERLAGVADTLCRGIANSKGPLLQERLQLIFLAVDRYVAKLKDVDAVFATEFRYFQEAPDEKRSEAERLASLIGSIGGSSDDVQLACFILFLFASEVEGQAGAFRDRKWHEDANLRVRIYLLIDFIRGQRRRASTPFFSN